jgi:fumarylpyruvate hydrolase
MTQYVLRPISVPVVGSDEQFPVRRVYCVGRYAAHAREMGFDPDREPPFSSVNLPMRWCPSLRERRWSCRIRRKPITITTKLSWWWRLAKREAISRWKKRMYIWGYATGLDMTRRDRQMEMRQMGRPWEIGKAFDLSAPIAPLHKRIRRR